MNDDEKQKLNETSGETVEEFVVFKDEPQDFSAQENRVSKEVVKDTEKIVKSKKTNKSRLLNAIFFCISVVVLVIIIVYQSRKYGIKDVGKLVTDDLNLKGVALIFLAFIGIMLCDTFRTYILLYKATKISRPIISYKSTAICRYYDCITPFSFGGQPFQIYYLSTRGVNAGIATSVPMAKYMFSQISFSIIALIMLILGSGTYGEQSKLVVTISIISLVISMLFLLDIIFLSLSKKVAPRLVKFLSKLNLVKDYEKTYRARFRSLLEYQKSIRYYLRSFWVALCTFIASALMVILRALIPYLIYMMLSSKMEVGFAVIFCKCVICELATMYIPLPGGAGMAEISFTALFSSLFSDGLLFWAMLIYRIASYYIYILQGVLVIVYDLIVGEKRDKKYKETKLVELKINAMYKDHR